MTDLDILAVHASARPDDVAVIEDDRVVSLQDFNALVNQYADVLRGADVRAGEKVLWVGQNSTEVVAINHAARKVGAVCVPMNYRLAPDEAAYVIDNCDAVVILFDVEQASQLEPILEQCDRVRSWLSFRNQGRAVPSWTRDLDAEAQEASTDEPTCTPSSRPTRATRWIPRTASGKILKRQLREPYWAGRTAKIG